MDMSNTLHDLSARLDDASRSLTPHLHRFPAEIGELMTLQKDLRAKQARFSLRDQPLSIGIMGQVKAGKSSFLNALLFEGRPVLPEAATPKTANLTRISYGESPTLVVHYYSRQSWGELESLAAGVGQHSEARVACELIGMVRQAGVDVRAVLGKGSERVQAESVEQLIGVLNDYVGSNGRYTALVESTELWLPLDELKGIEVVDTPGMNDPVQSRTQKTREYMARCDVVFFLSRCGQFLDQSDMDLLASQLPGKGVKRLILVAGQYDNVLLDDGYDHSSLAKTEANIQSRLGRGASEKFERLASEREKQGMADVAALLRGIKTPIFSSSFAYGFAHWPRERWSASMRHSHGQLSSMAADHWNGYVFTVEDWRRIAHFEPLREAFNAARADKEKLLAAQREGLLPEAERGFGDAMARLHESVDLRAQQLRKGDVAELVARQAGAEKRIGGIANALAEHINKARDEALRMHRTMRAELQAGVSESGRLQTRTGTDVHVSSREVSTSTWYKPWTWGDTETVYSTRTTSYQYIAASDAIERVVNYAHENKAALLRAFNIVINPAKLRSDLRRALLNELDTRNENFDPAEFRSTLNGSLERLVIPELVLDISDPSRAISGNFSGEVRGNDAMNQLRKALEKSLETVSRQLGDAFQKGGDELCGQLDTLRDTLADDLARDIREELQRLKDAFADKENELKLYAEITYIVNMHQNGANPSS